MAGTMSGWPRLRLAEAWELQARRLPPAEVTVPVLHRPPDDIFPTVQCEPPHPQLVAVTANITHSCSGELGSVIFVTHIPIGLWRELPGEQSYVAMGLSEPPHEHRSTGVQRWPTLLLKTKAQRCFARLEPMAEANL